MADTNVDNSIHTPVLNKSVLENGDICCYNCELLNLKLQKVSSDLSSALETKILQEEENRHLLHGSKNMFIEVLLLCDILLDSFFCSFEFKFYVLSHFQRSDPHVGLHSYFFISQD